MSNLSKELRQKILENLIELFITRNHNFSQASKDLSQDRQAFSNADRRAVRTIANCIDKAGFLPLGFVAFLFKANIHSWKILAARSFIRRMAYYAYILPFYGGLRYAALGRARKLGRPMQLFADHTAFMAVLGVLHQLEKWRVLKNLSPVPVQALKRIGLKTMAEFRNASPGHYPILRAHYLVSVAEYYSKSPNGAHAAGKLLRASARGRATIRDAFVFHTAMEWF